MLGILQIAELAAFLLAGAALPRLRLAGRSLAPPKRAVDAMLKGVLRILLLAMGYRLGGDRGLSSRLAEMGALSLAAAALAVAGTLVAIALARALLSLGGPSRSRVARPGPAAAAAAGNAAITGGAAPAPGGGAPSLRGRLKEPLSLLAMVAGGFLLGLALPVPEALDLSSLTSWILDALLFLIGLQFAQSGISLKGVLLDPRILATPIATAAGSLGAGLALAPLFGLAPGKAMSLVGGFGWYSLSGALISDLGDPFLGSASFLANMAREAIALVAIPFLSRTAMPELAIGVGGATAMDVTLPLIEEGAGPGIVPASFASGALLSLAVPLIVPLLYGLG